MNKKEVIKGFEDFLGESIYECLETEGLDVILEKLDKYINNKKQHAESKFQDMLTIIEQIQELDISSKHKYLKNAVKVWF